MVVAGGRLVEVLRRSDRGVEAFEAGLPLVWVMVPTVTLIALSVVQPLFIPRYLFEILPGVAVLVGATVSRLASARGRDRSGRRARRGPADDHRC